MAGKHTGAFSPFPDGSGALPGFQWNERTTKAYSEGRLGNVANGHLVGSDAHIAFDAGRDNAADPAYQFETAGIGGAPLFSPEAQAVIDKMTAPTTKERNAIANFVDDMQADSMWAGFMDSFQCYLMDSQVNALVDWVAAGPAINAGTGAAFSANVGFTFSGADDWINTSIVPSAMPNQTSVDGRMFSRWDGITNVAPNIDLCGGTWSGGSDVTRFRNSGGNLQGTWNKSFGADGTALAAMDNKVMVVQYGSLGGTHVLYVSGVEDGSGVGTVSQEVDGLIAVNGTYDSGGAHVNGTSGLIGQLWGMSKYTGVNEVAFNDHVEALVAALTV